MNKFTQEGTYLFGSIKDIKKLEEKENAAVLIISDTHGDFGTLHSILKQFGAECDALIFAGDGIAELAAIADESCDNSDFQKFIPPVIAAVEGNNDQDFYPFRNYLSDSPYYIETQIPLNQSLTICGHNIFVTHGHRFSLYDGVDSLVETAAECGAEIAVFGHTHIAMECLYSGNVYIVNPGSCSLPRGFQPPTFALMKLKKNQKSFDFTFYEFNSAGCKPYIPSVDNI